MMYLSIFYIYSTTSSNYSMDVLTKGIFDVHFRVLVQHDDGLVWFLILTIGTFGRISKM